MNTEIRDVVLTLQEAIQKLQERETADNFLEIEEAIDSSIHALTRTKSTLFAQQQQQQQDKRIKHTADTLDHTGSTVTEENRQPPPPRDVVLTEATFRLNRLQTALPLFLSVVEHESDEICIMATLSCLLFETMTQTNWCGFYRNTGNEILKIGPYQGRLGCLTIPFDRGVCGQVALTRNLLRVPNVHDFPKHIACDSNSQSELVIPLVNKRGDLLGVLDLDSPFLDGFSLEEAQLLDDFLRTVFGRL